VNADGKPWDQFQVLFRHLSEGTEENRNFSQDSLFSDEDLLPGTAWRWWWCSANITMWH